MRMLKRGKPSTCDTAAQPREREPSTMCSRVTTGRDVLGAGLCETTQTSRHADARHRDSCGRGIALSRDACARDRYALARSAALLNVCVKSIS